VPSVLTDPAVTVGFTVKIDGHDLGAFVSCEGLSFEVAIEAREEGGNNRFVHQLPGRIKYSNVKFTRPINAYSAAVARWFASMSSQIRRTQAEICAVSMDGKVITRWGLTGVIPVRWSGPTLSADSPQLAKETLEIAHHGFLDAG
jgi:phage tail-like protein